MKRWLGWFVLALFTCANSFAGVEWYTDTNAALAKAKAENKCVLLDFTGSDWCGWCKKLKSEVYDHRDFAAFANPNLVMVEVDFPRAKPISAQQLRANEALGRKYGVDGYPTTVLLNGEGKKLGQVSGYIPGGPSAFISMLKEWQSSHHITAAPSVPVPDNAPEPSHRPHDAVPVPPAAPDHSSELALKAISGAKGHRMAMINNAILAVGETGKVKVHDDRIDVTCKEIRDDSVLILVEGQTRELTLAHQ